MLDTLAKAAIERKKIQIKKLKGENPKDRGEEGNVVEIEEEVPDMINKEIDYGDSQKASNVYDDLNRDDDADEEKVSSILKPDIPREAWQREVERVSNKLKIDYEIGSYNTTEWRVHIEQIKSHESGFMKSVPNTRNVLEKLSEEIDRILEKIQKKEAMISKNFSNIVNEIT